MIVKVQATAAESKGFVMEALCKGLLTPHSGRPEVSLERSGAFDPMKALKVQEGNSSAIQRQLGQNVIEVAPSN